ncbi:hypothetical protein [Streptomyces sp. NRRL F-5630]|uniref:hypothetical protein n=1 Tax=Streptomyces sp. NRRL F-5630 TaxID=1463864 RepID=UPI0004C67477|nr:hypothetical protein [Streptomyces sp. NRRL F-5630]
MAPEIVTALVSSAGLVLVAVVGVVPALAALRRTRAAVQEQAEETRGVTLEALDAVGSRLSARFDARVDDIRDDIDAIREDVARVREWQAGHDAEHLIIGRHHGGPTA